MELQNLHTHSLFCDGENSPEDIVIWAYEHGFSSVGFSSHSFTEFDLSCCMKDEAGYASECRRLKNKYADKIDVLTGLEQDYFSCEPQEKYDYIIGSVHYLKIGEEYIPVDESPEVFCDAANRLAGGKSLNLALEYYRLEADVAEKTRCRIVGHFDLIEKFLNISAGIIDFDCKEYIDAKFAALDKLINQDVIFEVNTGAMARGLRRLPYPSADCLKRINQKGGRVLISSDCHKKRLLDFGFEDAAALLKSIGFKESYYLKDEKFLPAPL